MSYMIGMDYSKSTTTWSFLIPVKSYLFMGRTKLDPSVKVRVAFPREYGLCDSSYISLSDFKFYVCLNGVE